MAFWDAVSSLFFLFNVMRRVMRAAMPAAKSPTGLTRIAAKNSFMYRVALRKLPDSRLVAAARSFVAVAWMYILAVTIPCHTTMSFVRMMDKLTTTTYAANEEVTAMIAGTLFFNVLTRL